MAKPKRASKVLIRKKRKLDIPLGKNITRYFADTPLKPGEKITIS